MTQASAKLSSMKKRSRPMSVIEKYISNDTIVEFFTHNTSVDDDESDDEVVRNDDLVDFSMLDFD